MQITISKAWVSPSTLHLMLCVEVGKHGHILFRSAHMPIEQIDGQQWVAIVDEVDELEVDQPLPDLA
jgi:hypothetical protein